MTSKQWLLRVRNIDREIDALLREKQATRDRLTNITQNYSGDGVQSTKDPHKFDRLAELDSLIDSRVSELVRIKAETLNVISCLDNRLQREILCERYLGNKTFEEIAVQVHYSYKQVCRIHGKALIAIAPIIERCP